MPLEFFFEFEFELLFECEGILVRVLERELEEFERVALREFELEWESARLFGFGFGYGFVADDFLPGFRLFLFFPPKVRLVVEEWVTWEFDECFAT